MFVTALMYGSGMHLLQTILNEHGHAAWMAINDWYGSATTSRTIIAHYRNKLEGLRLESNMEGSQYVNDFII